jgi:hypothetical protein
MCSATLLVQAVSRRNAMHVTVLMLIALGGLGCQNPVDDVPPIPPVAGQPAAPSTGSVPAYEPAPSTYTPYYGGGFDSADPYDDQSFGACVRDTFCSFFIGRSPDVPSARQIEAAYRAGYSSR